MVTAGSGRRGNHCGTGALRDDYIRKCAARLLRRAGASTPATSPARIEQSAAAPPPAKAESAAVSPAALPAASATAVGGPNEPADAIQNFGLSNAQRHAPQQGPVSIQAHVAQVIVDQLQRNYVVLDNGQTWACTEGAMLLDSGELVTISHGALGSFMLASAKSRHSYHVRRIR